MFSIVARCSGGCIDACNLARNGDSVHAALPWRMESRLVHLRHDRSEALFPADIMDALHVSSSDLGRGQRRCPQYLPQTPFFKAKCTFFEQILLVLKKSKLPSQTAYPTVSLKELQT
jgi:hypothetical protein